MLLFRVFTLSLMYEQVPVHVLLPSERSTADGTGRTFLFPDGWALVPGDFAWNTCGGNGIHRLCKSTRLGSAAHCGDGWSPSRGWVVFRSGVAAYGTQVVGIDCRAIRGSSPLTYLGGGGKVRGEWSATAMRAGSW